MPSIVLILALVISILLISTSTAQSVDKPECTKEGEYCQNHWECCSNSCFSYVYKCVKSSQQKPDYTSSIYLAPSGGQYINYDKKENLEQLIANIFVPTQRPPLTIAEQIQLAERIGEDDDTATDGGGLSPVLPECFQIGQKCYRDSECCTKRCHGFLHKCVS